MYYEIPTQIIYGKLIQNEVMGLKTFNVVIEINLPHVADDTTRSRANNQTIGAMAEPALFKSNAFRKWIEY